MISLRHIKLSLPLVGLLATVHFFAEAKQQAALTVTTSERLQVLQGLSPSQLLQVMRAWSDALGVDCHYCHQGSFEAETSRKQIARLMQREYIAKLKQRDGSAIQCVDCHQGQTILLSARTLTNAANKSSTNFPAVRFARVKLKSTGVMLWRVTTKVPLFPKKHFMEGMLSFNQALGANCNYCHKKGDFEAETPRKKIARFMLSEYNGKLIKQGNLFVSCNDCHKGSAHPLGFLKTLD